MIEKKHIKCIKRSYCGPFYDNYIAYIRNEYINTNIYDLRIMNKHIIISFSEERLVQYEYYIRIRIRHPFMLNILCTFQDYDNLFILSECATVNLIEFMKLRNNFSKKMASFYISEIILALEYLSLNDLTYGLMTHESIFVNDSGHIKLKYDFLNSLNEKKDGIRDIIEYASPEFLRKQEHTLYSDVWNIGIILYYLIVGYTPFYAETSDLIKSNILEQDVQFLKHMDTETQDLISKMLHKIPEMRLTYKEIKKHSFFNEINWEEVEQKKVEPPFMFDEIIKYRRESGADLDKLYTTDFFRNQFRDGYGRTFRYFGFLDVDNPYIGSMMK